VYWASLAVASSPASDPATATVLAVVFLPFAAAAATPAVYRLLGERTAYFAAAVALACFALVTSLHGTAGTVEVPWIPSLAVSLRFYVDGLSLLIGFLASGVGVLILTYSRGYMHGERGGMRYYATLLAFMGAMLGIAFAADLLALFLFWELTSVSSYLLIGHYRRTESAQRAARKAMLVTVTGGLFMLIGFLLLRATAATVLGTPSFDLVAMLSNAAAMRAALADAGLLVPVVLLIGVGAAAKSAQVPLHFWLPDAMEAPTPVSAFLHSATMVKAGVYLVGRMRPLLVGDEWTLLFVPLGLATMTITAILAVAASDIKELLAYSTASHLGLIVAGFGLDEYLGAEAGVMHILNHAAFKAALFLVAGIVAHEAGTRAVDELGGLGRDLPVTAAITVVAALSMAGVPPFAGFYSKELLFEATYEAAVHAGGGLAWLLPAVAVFASVFTFLYSVRFLMLFFGDRPEGLDVHAPPRIMLLPPAILGAIVAALSVAPGLGIEGIVQRAFEGASTAPGGSTDKHVHAGLPTEASPAALMSLVTIFVGAVAYFGYPGYGRLRRWIRRAVAVDPLRPNWWYTAGVAGAERASARATPLAQNGLLRTYAAWALAGTSALALGGYVAAGVGLPALESIALAPETIVVLTVAAGGAVALSRAPSHVAGVLVLSIVGLMIAIFYILSNAPDLALTQLVVETLVLVIFLVVLDRLPAFYGEATTGRLARDGALSVVVGATVATTVLLATSSRADDPIFGYFVEQAPLPEGGGGHNVVNVILVDFRAFDTLGEIAVVALAAVSIVTLVAMREGGETR
jgi:multicomponent Na+:H+ antiporter subunit A